MSKSARASRRKSLLRRDNGDARGGVGAHLPVVSREVQLAPQLLLRQVTEKVAPPAAHGRAPRARTRREHRQHPRGEVVRQVAQQGG